MKISFAYLPAAFAALFLWCAPTVNGAGAAGASGGAAAAGAGATGSAGVPSPSGTPYGTAQPIAAPNTAPSAGPAAVANSGTAYGTTAPQNNSQNLSMPNGTAPGANAAMFPGSGNAFGQGPLFPQTNNLFSTNGIGSGVPTGAGMPNQQAINGLNMQAQPFPAQNIAPQNLGAYQQPPIIQRGVVGANNANPGTGVNIAGTNNGASGNVNPANLVNSPYANAPPGHVTGQVNPRTQMNGANDPNSWRVVNQNGQYWYWAPGNYWMYYQSGAWSRYNPATGFSPRNNLSHQTGVYGGAQ